MLPIDHSVWQPFLDGNLNTLRHGFYFGNLFNALLTHSVHISCLNILGMFTYTSINEDIHTLECILAWMYACMHWCMDKVHVWITLCMHGYVCNVHAGSESKVWHTAIYACNCSHTQSFTYTPIHAAACMYIAYIHTRVHTGTCMAVWMDVYMNIPIGIWKVFSSCYQSQKRTNYSASSTTLWLVPLEPWAPVFSRWMIVLQIIAFWKKAITIDKSAKILLQCSHYYFPRGLFFRRSVGL